MPWHSWLDLRLSERERKGGIQQMEGLAERYSGRRGWGECLQLYKLCTSCHVLR